MKRYRPVSARKPEQVEKYNAAVRLRRMRKRIESGKIPYPKKFTPRADELLKLYGLQDAVILPRPGVSAIVVQKVRLAQSEKRRKSYRNVRFQ